MGELAFLWLGKGGTGNDALHTVALRTWPLCPPGAGGGRAGRNNSRRFRARWVRGALLSLLVY